MSDKCTGYLFAVTLRPPRYLPPQPPPPPHRTTAAAAPRFPFVVPFVRVYVYRYHYTCAFPGAVWAVTVPVRRTARQHAAGAQCACVSGPVRVSPAVKARPRPGARVRAKRFAENKIYRRPADSRRPPYESVRPDAGRRIFCADRPVFKKKTFETGRKRHDHVSGSFGPFGMRTGIYCKKV